MTTVAGIRILEQAANAKGDLFGRLMCDLFCALGYDNIRLNVQKAGREIDLTAEHRTESRLAIAECKATAEMTGGDDLNKFAGVLQVERAKLKDRTITGYYVSLSGFKETAVEQEKDAGGNRFVTMNWTRVAQELVKGRIVVSPELAMERAGRCAARAGLRAKPLENLDLLAHELGWIWVVYFQRGRQRTHFALIHADGEALAPGLAQRVIDADTLAGGHLGELKYLDPGLEAGSTAEQVLMARAKYLAYLAAEYGVLTLEGLPADQELGSRTLNLEHIYVPLHLEPASVPVEAPPEPRRPVSEVETKATRQLVGEVLASNIRLAVLAAPGGGKTTLMKRLVTAYAYPERRTKAEDGLPEREWLPLLVRCRQLGASPRTSITDLLHAIPRLAEMNELADAFVAVVDDALRSGTVLLLVDGLDEIPDEGQRVAFVKQLRTFLATYPSIGAVVSSRDAGFRVVGGALNSTCALYRVSELDDNDIKALTVAWYREVVGDRPSVITDASRLADAIVQTDRVRQLAKNPLLLTTLLLVKRWVSQLPTRRTALYAKAIEVLLMTWNVEGHEPIDLEEAIPQLAFVAYAMMKEGIQRITLSRLTQILALARKEMPEVLGYAKQTVGQFIQSVELRSSLLMLSGHKIEGGTIQPTYEFRHLTFQEYLAARAVVDGFHPGRVRTDTILTVLEPHLANPQWREVIPLAAVLAGRQAEVLVDHLVKRCEVVQEKGTVPRRKRSTAAILGQCIIDEVQVSPSLLSKCFLCLAVRGRAIDDMIPALALGKYGGLMLEVLMSELQACNKSISDVGSVLSRGLLARELGWSGRSGFPDAVVERSRVLLTSDDIVTQTKGALAVMSLAFYQHQEGLPGSSQASLLSATADDLLRLLGRREEYTKFAAAWALAWIGTSGLLTQDHARRALDSLFAVWRKAKNSHTRRDVAWAITRLPIMDRDTAPVRGQSKSGVAFLKQQPIPRMDDHGNRMMSTAARIIGFYWGTPWSDDEIRAWLAANREPDFSSPIYDALGIKKPAPVEDPLSPKE